MFGLAGCWYVTVPISYQLVRPKQGDRSAAEVSWNPWIPPRKLPFCMVYPQKPLKTYCIFVGTFSFHRVETTTITASLAGTSNTPGLLWCGCRDAVVGYSRSNAKSMLARNTSRAEDHFGLLPQQFSSLQPLVILPGWMLIHRFPWFFWTNTVSIT